MIRSTRRACTPDAPRARRVALSLLLAAAAGLLALPPAPADAQTARAVPPPPNARLVLQAAGRCLGVNDAQLGVDGARVQLGDCDGRPSQAWRPDQGRLVNLATGRCLDVHGPDAGVDGARVQAVNCSAAPNQLWQTERGLLVARVDGRCLEVYGTEAERGVAQVRTWVCDGSPGQRWAVASQPEAPPEVARDIEAGPIFSTVEAGKRCPAVCAPGRWTGVWRTTVLGRMSVCNCAEMSALPARPELRAPGPMSDARFAELLRAMEAESFASSKLQVLEGVARDNLFVVEQLRRIVQAMTFSGDKLRAVEIVAPRVIDRANSFTLYSAFDFDSEREQVRKVFDRLPPR
jgi:hypothetical protein